MWLPSLFWCRSLQSYLFPEREKFLAFSNISTSSFLIFCFRKPKAGVLSLIFGICCGLLSTAVISVHYKEQPLIVMISQFLKWVIWDATVSYVKVIIRYIINCLMLFRFLLRIKAVLFLTSNHFFQLCIEPQTLKHDWRNHRYSIKHVVWCILEWYLCQTMVQNICLLHWNAHRIHTTY